MLSKQTLIRIYKLLNDVTPLPADCGRLCNKICCSEWDEGVGMYLLPGEEQMFTDADDWLEWEIHPTTAYRFPPTWKGHFYFVRCTRPCPRDRRPFACRTFPLRPRMISATEWILQFDETARLICPLAEKGLSFLQPEFIERVHTAWEVLMEDDMIRDDVIWRSRR